MPRKRALEAATDAADGSTEEVDSTPQMTEMEARRAAIIAQNRERLLQLGIPSLVKELQQQAAAAGGGGAAKKKKKRAKEEGKPRVKREPGAPERPSRRSSRLQDAAQHPKPKAETGEERFERELGEFAVEGCCPRCGREMERGHRSHLQGCTGAQPKPRQPRAADEEELEGLTEEERRDQQKRTLARMKKLHLDGLMELGDEQAKFVVLGSTGNHYTVTLSDAKHTCQCLDYRFRRHHCKHICLVLSQLSILDKPHLWKEAVNSRMDELLAQQRERQQQQQQAVALPRDKNTEVALRLL